VYSVVFSVSIFFIVLMLGGGAYAGEEAPKNASAVAANKEILVFVTIPPVAGLVEQVGGPLVRVSVLAEKGQDPHTFEATPKQIAMLGKANLYFIVGLPLEKRLQEKIQSTNPNLLVVDTTEGIEKRDLTGRHHDEQGAGGRHGVEEPGAGAGYPAPGPRPPTPESGANASAGEGPAQLPAAHPSAKSATPPPRGEPDPHVWLSPPLLQAQSRRIAEALAKVDPGHAGDYARNQRALSEKLDSLDARIKKRLEPYRGRAFYVYHPAFGYFADRYGLRQEVVEVDGKSPAPRQLADYIRRAKADGVKTVFIQPQFDPKNAAAIAQSIGGKVETLDDLARDVVANLEDIAAKIEAAFQNPKPR
jgi:zinc transport system substrate-binding protein